MGTSRALTPPPVAAESAELTREKAIDERTDYNEVKSLLRDIADLG